MSRTGSRLFLLGWATAGILVGAVAMRAHWVPLPVSPSEATRPNPTGSGEWKAFHVLLDGCECSRRIHTHLARRPVRTDTRERIVWVTDQPDRVAAIPGYEWEPSTAQHLADHYGVEAAPVLVIVDPSGTVRYRGGYTARKQGFEIHDTQLIEQARRGEVPPPLPVYGCLISERLRTASSFLPP